MQQRTIPITAIEAAERVMDQAPTCNATEVPKAEAMRRLLSPIAAMQAKGYGLAEIARVLTESGISLTEVGLKNYLTRLSAETEKEPGRKARRDGTRRQAASVPADKPPPAASSRIVHAFNPPTGTRQEPVRPPDPARAAPSAASPATPTESPKQAPSASPQDSGARRSGFAVRPDTKNI
ncbi:MAG: hypothetical protein ACRENC_10905 [Gemmatimonadaceae bacterium]